MNLNSPAPDFTLQNVEGQPVSLRQTCQSGQPVVLIFLRHLGCIPCREHALALCKRQAELKQYNARVFIISFGTLPALHQWMKETCGEFDVLIDRERAVYSAYQLERSFWRSRSLKTRWFYFKAWLSGKQMHDSNGDDTSQLGGDFIVDKNGLLCLVHPSREPVDRPPVDELFKTLAAL